MVFIVFNRRYKERTKMNELIDIMKEGILSDIDENIESAHRHNNVGGVRMYVEARMEILAATTFLHLVHAMGTCYKSDAHDYIIYMLLESEEAILS